MHKTARAIGIFASGAGLVAAAITQPTAPLDYSMPGVLHMALPVFLYMFARCWMAEGRARERRARGIPDDD